MAEQPFSILVIDDEDVIRETFQEILEDAGYTVGVAENATEALDILKQRHFDILLVDYNLPDMNGVALIKEAFLISKEFVSILVTGFNSLEVAVEGMRVGIHDYLVKPVDLEELRTLILNTTNELVKSRQGKDKFKKIIKSITIGKDEGSVIDIIENKDHKK